ncbi:hypothetical protein ES702_06812 [subsurface metagenome]
METWSGGATSVLVVFRGSSAWMERVVRWYLLGFWVGWVWVVGWGGGMVDWVRPAVSLLSPLLLPLGVWVVMFVGDMLDMVGS